VKKEWALEVQAANSAHLKYLKIWFIYTNEPGKNDLSSISGGEQQAAPFFSSPGRSSHPCKLVHICLLIVVSLCLDLNQKNLISGAHSLLNELYDIELSFKPKSQLFESTGLPDAEFFV